MNLSDLCKAYNMEDYTAKDVNMTSKQLINQFTSGVDKSYLAYKEQASIDRALLKCKITKRSQTKTEKKIDEIIAKETEEIRQKIDIKLKKALRKVSRKHGTVNPFKNKPIMFTKTSDGDESTNDRQLMTVPESPYQPDIE